MHFPTLLVAAAVGVSAHPSGHNHRSFHAKKEAGTRSEKLITATINGKVVTWTQGAASPWKQDVKPEVKVAVAAPAPTPSPEVKTAAFKETEKAKDKDTSPLSGVVGLGIKAYEAFTGCNMKREDYSETTKEDIAAVGNTACGGKYGGNFKLVASEGAMKGFKYGIKVTGGSKKLTCGAFNKISANGGIDGFWVKNHALPFDVPANGEQWIAVASNTQGGIMCSHDDKIPERKSDGYPTVTWAEFDLGSARNKGFSGFDASGLPASKSGTACNALKLCAINKSAGASLSDDKRCSTINAGMACDGTNAYVTGTEWKGGLGSSIGPVADGESFFLHADYS